MLINYLLLNITVICLRCTLTAKTRSAMLKDGVLVEVVFLGVVYISAATYAMGKADRGPAYSPFRVQLDTSTRLVMDSGGRVEMYASRLAVTIQIVASGKLFAVMYSSTWNF